MNKNIHFLRTIQELPFLNPIQIDESNIKYIVWSIALSYVESEKNLHLRLKVIISQCVICRALFDVEK